MGSGSGVHGTLPAEVLSVDYQGLINPTSVRGHTGFFVFKDLFSGFRHAVFVKDIFCPGTHFITPLMKSSASTNRRVTLCDS